MTGALETLKPRQLRCSVSVRFCCWGHGKFGMVGVAVGSFGGTIVAVAQSHLQ